MSLTRQKIHAVLRKAGHSRRESHTTCVREWRAHSSGYDVRETDGAFYVEWYNGNHYATGEQVRAKRLREVEKYAVALGFFGAQIVNNGGFNGDEPRVRIAKAVDP